jgi:lipopolysaccharide assembly protein A
MRTLIASPFLLILVLFALSNTAVTRVTLWPTDFELDMPLSLVILAAMAIAFLVGGVFVWFAEMGQRRRARRAEQTVRLLEAQVEDLKARLPATVALPSR